MPFCFGTHPSFRCPFSGSESQFTDYEVRFDRDEIPTQPVLNGDKLLDRVNRQPFMADPRTIKLDYSVFEKIDTIIFDEIHSDKVRLVDTGTGKYLELRYQGSTRWASGPRRRARLSSASSPGTGRPTPPITDGLYLRKVGLRPAGARGGGKLYADDRRERLPGINGHEKPAGLRDGSSAGLVMPHYKIKASTPITAPAAMRTIPPAR